MVVCVLVGYCLIGNPSKSPDLLVNNLIVDAVWKINNLNTHLSLMSTHLLSSTMNNRNTHLGDYYFNVLLDLAESKFSS